MKIYLIRHGKTEANERRLYCGSTDIALSDILFEVCSALGTVGITAGLTPALPVLCKLVLMLLMYCGRMGSLTFALVFTENRKNSLLQKPVERIPIG